MRKREGISMGVCKHRALSNTKKGKWLRVAVTRFQLNLLNNISDVVDVASSNRNGARGDGGLGRTKKGATSLCWRGAMNKLTSPPCEALREKPRERVSDGSDLGCSLHPKIHWIPQSNGQERLCMCSTYTTFAC